MTRLSRSSVSLLLGVVSASVALLLSGCGIGALAPATTNTFAPTTGRISGIVHGGRQPIVGATVTLYSAGSSNYGTGFTQLAQNLTNANGGFSFNKGTTAGTGSDQNWTCPSDNSDPIIYLIAAGGVTSSAFSASSPQAVLAGAIGPCSTISASTPVNLNEITTAAFTAAFAPYMYPGVAVASEGIGSNGAYCLSGLNCNSGSGTTQSALGLYNAFMVYSNDLINVAQGQEIAGGTSFYGASSSVSQIQVNAVAESQKLISIGNILAACVNADPTALTAAGSSCAKLFGAAPAPVLASATSYGSSFPSFTFNANPVDTLQAALYMQLNPAGISTTASPYDTTDCGSATATVNPTPNVACLLNTVQSTKPYQGDLGDAGLTASDWTIGVSYTATGSCGTGTSGGKFIDAAYRTQVDASGNIFFISGDATSGAANLSEMTPWGQPLLCVGQHTEGRDLTIDPSGNVWTAFYGSATSVYELKAGDAALTAWPPAAVAYGIVSDGSGNIFYTNLNSQGNSLYKLSTAAITAGPLASNNGTFLADPIETAGNAPGNSNYLAFSPTGQLWSVNQDSVLAGSFTPSTGGVLNGTLSCAYWSFTASTGNLVCYTATLPSSVVKTGDDVTLSGFSTTAGSPSVVVGLNGTHAAVRTYTTTKSTPTGGSGSYYNYSMYVYSTDTATNETLITETGTPVATVTDNSYAFGYTSITSTVFGNAIDAAGYIYTGQLCCGTTGRELLKLTGSTSAGTATSNRSAAGQAGMNGATAVALDGANNVWVANALSATTGGQTATGGYPVAEIATSTSGGTTTFTSLSPDASGSVTCTTTSCASLGGILKTSIGNSRGISVDPSGNVWIPVIGTNSNLTSGTNIVQIVGAAVPVVTPLSSAIGTTGTSKLGVKP